MEGEKKRELAALREAGLAKDQNWKPWRDPVFTERLYREDYAPGSAGQNGARYDAPWSVGDDFVSDCGRYEFLEVVDKDGGEVALIQIPLGKGRADVIPLASLITAAPQVIEALTRLVADFESEIHNEYDGTSMLDERLSEIDYARAAIAAAIGEEV